MQKWKHRTDSLESLNIQDTTLQSRMSDLTDGPEAAAAGNSRMLEGHAEGGPQGKRRKHEERGVNPANSSGQATAPAPHLSAAKKPRKAPALCHIDSAESLHMEDMPKSRMSDHTDGLEATAAGKKRMLEEHASRGPQEKRCQHEERGLNLDNASGLATAPAPQHSAAKKPHKAPALCEHQRRRSKCKQCGGSSICEHQRVRSTCKDCGGGSVCEHQRQRSMCKDCGGSGLCEHQRQRSTCKDCGGGSICEHQRRNELERGGRAGGRNRCRISDIRVR